jgi:hypothetical protein
MRDSREKEWAVGWERGEEEKKRKREDRGHMASCEWVERNDEIFLNQSGYNMWQREITLFLKPQTLIIYNRTPLFINPIIEQLISNPTFNLTTH